MQEDRTTAVRRDPPRPDIHPIAYNNDARFPRRPFHVTGSTVTALEATVEDRGDEVIVVGCGSDRDLMEITAGATRGDEYYDAPSTSVGWDRRKHASNSRDGLPITVSYSPDVFGAIRPRWTVFAVEPS